MSEGLARSLVDWFRKVREPYPFRQNRSPYRVWVSEVALQQTRIQAALVPLGRFFDAFPTLEDLAKAEESEVLRAFRGLGYYSRARNLLKAARFLVDERQGRFPEEYERLLEIPSIGPYTAAAVGSICYGRRYPVLDGNVKRILARLNEWGLPMNERRFVRDCEAFLRRVFEESDDHPGDLNEAFMELGQKICLKSSPQCPICPVGRFCRSFRAGTTSDYPRPPRKPDKIDVDWHVYLMQDPLGRILLHAWRGFPFLEGHTAFPCIAQYPETGESIASWAPERKDASDIRARERDLGEIERRLPPLKHAITRHRIRIFPAVGVCALPTGDSRFLRIPQAEVESQLVSSAMNKVWQAWRKAERSGCMGASK